MNQQVDRRSHSFAVARDSLSFADGASERGSYVRLSQARHTGNSELRLNRQLADKRIFPAVDVNASSTRREEMLLSPDEVKITWKLRRALAGLDPQQALEVVLGKLKETQSNVEFLVQMQKSIPAPTSNGHGAGGHGHGHENSIR